jgi:hypothetical protein
MAEEMGYREVERVESEAIEKLTEVLGFLIKALDANPDRSTTWLREYDAVLEDISEAIEQMKAHVPPSELPEPVETILKRAEDLYTK